MALTQRIKELRTRNGLSQAALADRLHVSRQAVTKWEAGRGIPDVDNLRAMAALFGVSVDHLLDGTGDGAAPAVLGIPWTSPPLSRTSRPVDPWARRVTGPCARPSLTRPSTPSRGCGPITGCRSSSSGG